MADKTQMTKYTKEQMLEWLDETIRLEAGSDACFPNAKFDEHTIVKQIRQYINCCCLLDNTP